MNSIYYFFTTWPTFSGPGSKELNYGRDFLYPGALVFFIFLILWVLGLTVKKFRESNKFKFIIWLGLKFALIAILIGLIFYIIGGVELLMSKF